MSSHLRPVKEVFQTLSEEVYYGFNLRLVMLTATDEEFKALHAIVDRAKRVRENRENANKASLEMMAK